MNPFTPPSLRSEPSFFPLAIGTGPLRGIFSASAFGRGPGHQEVDGGSVLASLFGSKSLGIFFSKGEKKRGIRPPFPFFFFPLFPKFPFPLPIEKSLEKTLCRGGESGNRLPVNFEGVRLVNSRSPPALRCAWGKKKLLTRGEKYPKFGCLPSSGPDRQGRGDDRGAPFKKQITLNKLECFKQAADYRSEYY